MGIREQILQDFLQNNGYADIGKLCKKYGLPRRQILTHFYRMQDTGEYVIKVEGHRAWLFRT